MKKKLVQILMAVHQGEAYLDQQISSIFNQTYEDFHLVIRDDYSQDRSLAIIQRWIDRYPDKITLLLSEKREGVIGNFSHLIDYASADYIMFADHDDVWLNSKIAQSLEKMSEMERTFGNIHPLLVHTDAALVDKNLQPFASSFWKYAGLNPSQGKDLSRQLIQNTITGCTMLINRALLDLIRPLPKEIVMHDWWIGIVASAFGEIDLVDASTMLYRQHGANDIGAKKYGMVSYFRKICDPSKRAKATQCVKMIDKQCYIFLQRYHRMINTQQRHLIEAFLIYQKASFFVRFYLAIKYGFFKHGLTRNIKELLFREMLP